MSTEQMEAIEGVKEVASNIATMKANKAYLAVKDLIDFCLENEISSFRFTKEIKELMD